MPFSIGKYLLHNYSSLIKRVRNHIGNIFAQKISHIATRLLIIQYFDKLTIILNQLRQKLEFKKDSRLRK